MKSYSNYLKIEKVSCLILFVALISSIPAFSQPETSLFDYWEYHSDQLKFFSTSLTDIGFDQIKEREQNIAFLKYKVDW